MASTLANRLFREILDAKYKEYDMTRKKFIDNYVIYPQDNDKKNALAEVINDFFDSIPDQSVKIATLEAKLYVYEKVIANSNFAPILDRPTPAPPMGINMEELEHSMSKVFKMPESEG